MSNYQFYSRPRHLRYIFFIDAATPYENALKLMKENLKIWGGRYNPIIPTTNGAFPDSYLKVIEYYDPDFVFHSSSVDPETLKKLRNFNPKAYVDLDKEPRAEYVEGVYCLHLLSQITRDQPILVPDGLVSFDDPLLNYFELNFGFTCGCRHKS